MQVSQRVELHALLESAYDDADLAQFATASAERWLERRGADAAVCEAFLVAVVGAMERHDHRQAMLDAFEAFRPDVVQGQRA